MKKNTQKFVHYVMITFTYSVGVGTLGAILYTFLIAFQKII
jgi:hypothetical protein